RSVLRRRDVRGVPLGPARRRRDPRRRSRVVPVRGRPPDCAAHPCGVGRAAFDRFPRTTYALARLPITFKAVEKLLRGDLTHPGAARGLERGAVKLIYSVAKAAAR